MNYRSLVFDFDGTLADTLEASLKIYNELASEHGLRFIQPDEVPTLRHMKLNALLNHLNIAKHRVPKLLLQGTKLLKSRVNTLSLFDGMDEVLRSLRSECDHFGILTSNSVENVKLFLSEHRLDDVFTFISSTSKLTGKAKHLRSIRRTFSINAEEMIYVGDEIRDIKAAKKAQVPIASVSWGFNSAEALRAANPEFLLHKPQDLLQLV